MNNKSLQSILSYCMTGGLLLLALSAPLSIAATQTAWALSLLIWIIRAFVVRPRLRTNTMDLAVLAFVGLTILSSLFSYEREVSIRKLVGVSLVTIVYLVSTNIKETRMIRRMVTVLLVSASVSAFFAVGLFAIGRNLKVTGLAASSPLRLAGIQENDTIQRANGQSVSSPDELMKALARTENGVAKLQIYRFEIIIPYDLSIDGVGTSGQSTTDLGITGWSRGRDVRASGFFGHYTTYAEAIQLILSIALGLFIMATGGIWTRTRILLAATIILFGAGLFLTVTRASWAGFALSAAVMIVVGASRRTVLICVLVAIPLAAGGLYYLQQKRNVAFIDSGDNSTTWRLTVWRESFGVLTSSARHLAVGVGMDSIKKHYLEWQMFDNGKLPIGHMHSTPLQFAFERGVPALLAWIIWMFVYLKLLWNGIRRPDLEWPERGLLLGAFGGTVGFLAGGLVHYNWGDSEVVMIFYLLMGLSLSILIQRVETGPEAVTP